MNTPVSSKVVATVADDDAKAGSVVLRGVTVGLDTAVGQAFVVDCARNIEGLMLDHDIKTKYELSDEDWERLATNTPLLRAVRAEGERRILYAEAPREAARRYFAKAPTVLRDILNNELVSPRHRIEAAKELRQTAGDGATPSTGQKFIINIRIGDKQIYREVEPHLPPPADDGIVP